VEPILKLDDELLLVRIVFRALWTGDGDSPFVYYSRTKNGSDEMQFGFEIYFHTLIYIC